GTHWLLGLQNRDGGVPTFCRGWGNLPFDRSSPDITAHAIRAWLAARLVKTDEARRIGAAVGRAVHYLVRTQRDDGAWVPLWFGNQYSANDENPLYGTARVIPALCAAAATRIDGATAALGKAVHWLVAKQNADGGWDGATGGRSSVEETGLA